MYIKHILTNMFDYLFFRLKTKLAKPVCKKVGPSNFYFLNLFWFNPFLFFQHNYFLAQSESPRSTSKPQQPQFKRVLHNENEPIRTSQSYEDNTVLEEFAKLYNGGRQLKENSPRTFKNTPKNEETYRKTPPKRNSPAGKSPKREKEVLRSTAEERQSQIMDDYLVPFHRSDTEEMYEARNYEENIIDNDSFIDNNKQYRTKKGSKKETSLNQFDSPNNNDDEELVKSKNSKRKTKKQPKSKSPPPVKKSSHPTSSSRIQVPFFV